jgi:hypothetical protein
LQTIMDETVKESETETNRQLEVCQ